MNTLILLTLSVFSVSRHQPTLPDNTRHRAQYSCIKSEAKNEINTVVLSYYDVALCNGDLDNCIHTNGVPDFADTTLICHPEFGCDYWYDKMAACSKDWFGRNISVLDLDLYCGDAFGFLYGRPVRTIQCDENGYYRRVDVFHSGEFDYNMWRVEIK